jgi:four helix bundle protein
MAGTNDELTAPAYYKIAKSLQDLPFVRGVTIANRPAMEQKRSISDELEERLIEFAAQVVFGATELPRTLAGRHIALQILRSGTAAAPNYAEARGAESRADFIHKLGIVQKELNETSVWLRIISRISLGKRDQIVAILQENVELARIISASIKTAKLEVNRPLG